MILISLALFFSTLFYYGCTKIVNSYALSGGYKITEENVIFDTGLHGLGTRENWVVEGADSKTFKPMKHPFSRDASHIFYNTKILSWYPDQFKVLGNGVIWKYSTDGQYVFHGASIMEQADPSSFVTLGNGFAKDHNYVYRGRSILKGLDPNSFEVLNEKHAKDARFVIYEERIIGGADPHSFEIHATISNEAKDRGGYYKSGYPSKADYGW